jgi:5-methylcytosine-specific restriction endonuclease McrA
MHRILLVISTLGCLTALPARAAGDEIIHLLDNTKIVGTLVHYYDGVLTIKLPNGTDLKLPATKVRRVQFKLPKARKELSSPKKTYERLRRAALKGDLPTYMDCHSTYYQMFLHHQVELATPKKFIKRLKKEWGDVQLQVLGVKRKGNTAIMKVRRTQGGNSQEGELRFIKEAGEWKMILPL